MPSFGNKYCPDANSPLIDAEIDEIILIHSKRLDACDNQSEVIRSGLLQNSVSYDRLKAEVVLLRADVKELTEEVRHNNKVIA